MQPTKRLLQALLCNPVFKALWAELLRILSQRSVLFVSPYRLGMEINLKDAVQFNWGFQGALQGAGTPNQAGIGAFLPIAVGDNSVFFADVLLNANFSDYDGYSSIISTEVAGTTISTSSRLGYRWLNNDRSWMFGVNAGYDSRPMNTGNADSGVTLYDKESAFFQQIAAGLEAVSDTWNFNA